MNKDKKPHHFDIHRSDFYEFNKPKERTLQRLTEIAECGMKIVGYGQFGYEGVMSGLYIEKVWSYSDEDFKDYMDYVKDLIAKHSLNTFNYKCKKCGSTYVNLKNKLDYSNCVVLQPSTNEKCNGQLVPF